MPSLAERIDDLVSQTLKHLGRGEIIQIAQNQSDYEVYPKWFKKDRIAFDGGIGIQRTLMNKLPGAAKHVGLFATDEVGIVNLLSTMNIGWKHVTTNWAYEIREMLMNKGETRINNIIKPRREGAIINLVEQLEEKAWACPTADNLLEPFGIPYWVVKSDTQGFNGGLPADHTTVAGVNLTLIPQFKNWTDTYSAISKAALIKKMRKAHRKTKFKSPVNKSEFYGPKGERIRYYMNEQTLSDLEDLGEAQNENLGRDLASMDDEIVFKRHPLVSVDALDADSDNPIYAIDHACFFPVVLKGDYLRETGPQQSPKQHNVREVHVDMTYNYLCLDRRRQQVFKYKAA